jgi:hypothetical protein
MKRSTANAELFGSGAHVTIRRGKHLVINFFSVSCATSPTHEPHLGTNARLFALLNIAMADAAICAWDAKYAFDFWRPVTAINLAKPELNWASFIRDTALP